ncbi:MAG: ATP-dependent sacrificial sulfur transferase LarE [Candidatus Omnitrophica bacterium]|nr:ATP-dependent sacrificial sulfur transferase LarE [Candidatus Omnitrophota bacterium]
MNKTRNQRPENSNEKLEKLKKILEKLGSVIIAYSGGVDSSLLLKVARDTLGKDSVLAVTAFSSTYPKVEYRQAKTLANQLGVEHLIVYTEELRNKNFRKNLKNRCFYCKHEFFKKLASLCQKRGFNKVIDGTNYEDRFDYRPGLKARNKWGVFSPLEKAGLRKEEIRRLAKDLRLPNWNKPAQPCLASRFSYGTEINLKKLSMIERAEEFLRGKGFSQVRVRLHQDIVRIEVEKEKISRIFSRTLREEIVRKFKRVGFKYIALDLEGYRMGSISPD